MDAMHVQRVREDLDRLITETRSIPSLECRNGDLVKEVEQAHADIEATFRAKMFWVWISVIELLAIAVLAIKLYNH